jgi:hypothetical protein
MPVDTLHWFQEVVGLFFFNYIMETQLTLETLAKLNAKIEAIQTKIDNNQAEVRSVIGEWMAGITDARKETVACNEAKNTVPDPEMMQSMEEL